MELVNKVILDSMVRLVREVPWGPSREQLLSMSAEFESDGRFERGWGMIEGDLQCVSKVEAGDIADLWATEFTSPIQTTAWTETRSSRLRNSPSVGIVEPRSRHAKTTN